MNVVRASLSEVAQASITSPILSPSPSVQSRKPHTASQLTTSARAKPQIACPMPLKVPYATSTKAAASSSQPPKQDSLNDFLDSRDEWDEKNVLFDDSIGYAGNLSSSTDDGESLINLIEAEWELEQIFRTAPTAAATNPHKRRFAWTLNEEDPLDSEDESSSWMLVEDDDLPRLGFSPQSRMEEAISAPSSLLPSPLCVVPPSRARNPVPLNTPFQASPSSSSSFLVDRAYQQQQQQQPARRDLYTSSPFFGADPNSHSDYALTEDYGLRVIEQRLEDCTLLSPSSSSSLAVPPSSPSSAVLGGHTRKRNRSYSDSMLKRDGVSDVANNLVVVS